MKTISRYIMTLALLITAATGAWAQDVLNIVVDGTSATIKYDGNASNNPYFGGDEWKQSEFPWDDEYTTRPTITTVTIDGSCKNFSGTKLRSLFIGFSGLTTINGLDNLNTANVQDMEYMFADCSSLTSLDLSSLNTASLTTMYNMFAYCSKLTSLDLSSWNTENVEMTSSLFFNCSELTTVDLSSWNTAKVWNTGYMFYNCSKLENIYVGDGWSTAKVTQSDDMFTGCTKLLSMNTANPATNKTNAHTGDGGYLKVKPAAASGPEVAWTAASKTGTFTMPGGNVTLEPEYYDLATLADKGLTAAEDAAAKTEAPLAVLAENAVTGGTLMYFVIYDENFSQADAIALAEDEWEAAIPTAETIDAAGTYYVWYYIKGDDEHSDTDPQRLAVTVLPEPTYTVEFAEGTEESDKWTVKAGTDGSFQSLPLEGVKAGTKVKLKYDGDRSMLKGVTAVKAVKKAGNAYLKWDADQKKLVATPMPESFTTVTSENTQWSAGTYVVEGQVEINRTIELSGDVNLIIKDDAKLTVYHLYGNSHNLSIYGQAQMTGELDVHYSGGDAINEIPTLEVHSAKVTATSSSDYGAGFGDIGTFNVYGGLVDAKGTAAEGGCGICLSENGSMNIYGGEVKAEGKGNDLDSYGITCAESLATTVKVYGGKLWAGCADNSALDCRGIHLTKDNGFSGKIETSDDNVSWDEYDDVAGRLDTKYVRVGY